MEAGAHAGLGAGADTGGHAAQGWRDLEADTRGDNQGGKTMRLKLVILALAAILIAAGAVVERAAKGNARMYRENWQAGRYGDELADWRDE